MNLQLRTEPLTLAHRFAFPCELCYSSSVDRLLKKNPFLTDLAFVFVRVQVHSILEDLQSEGYQISLTISTFHLFIHLFFLEFRFRLFFFGLFKILTVENKSRHEDTMSHILRGGALSKVNLFLSARTSLAGLGLSNEPLCLTNLSYRPRR